jgi:hypothetical protein
VRTLQRQLFAPQLGRDAHCLCTLNVPLWWLRLPVAVALARQVAVRRAR